MHTLKLIIRQIQTDREAGEDYILIAICLALILLSATIALIVARS